MWQEQSRNSVSSNQQCLTLKCVQPRCTIVYGKVIQEGTRTCQLTVNMATGQLLILPRLQRRNKRLHHSEPIAAVRRALGLGHVVPGGPHDCVIMT